MSDDAAAHDAAAYDPAHFHKGEMPIADHVSTFKGLMGLTKWGSLAISAFLVLLVVWFCTPAGFMPGFVSAIVVAIVGTLLLRGGGQAH